MKERVFMICDSHDEKAASINGAPNIGVEFMGTCFGRIVHEDGREIGSHCSSSFGWLRLDLESKLDDPDKYEVIDLIGAKTPEQFRVRK